jgi:hypothetical protein
VASKFSGETRVREVVEQLGERGRELLRKHGYEVGEGFTDVLSQYQTLAHAARQERLRGLPALVEELNADHKGTG